MGKAILVLGMHRSGTSALAGALARLGVELGDRLMQGAADDNPSGFYEHRDVVAAHDAVARSCGRTWDDPRPASSGLHDPSARAALGELLDEVVARDFADCPLWAVKDPRMCRFLPVWLELLERRGVEAHCLLIVRSPDEVAASLARRSGFSTEKSAALWVDHVLGALRDSAARPRARLSFDDLLADPPAVLSRCSAELGLDWPESPEASTERLAEFLRPELRRSSDGARAGAGPFQRLAEEMWNVLRVTSDWPGDEQLAAWERALGEQARSLPSLALEHATQLAERESHRQGWEAEGRIRVEVAKELTEVETRLAEEIARLSVEVVAIPEEIGRVTGEVGRVSEEVVAHSHELVKQGELLTDLHRQVLELNRSAGGGRGGGLIARIRRAISGAKRD